MTTTNHNPYIAVTVEREAAQRRLATQNPFSAIGLAILGLFEAAVQGTGKMLAPSVSFANKVRRAARALPTTKPERAALWDLAYARSRELYYSERMMFDALDADVFVKLHLADVRGWLATQPAGYSPRQERREERRAARAEAKIERAEARAAKKLARLEARALKTVEKTAKAEAKLQARVHTQTPATASTKNALHHRKTA